MISLKVQTVSKTCCRGEQPLKFFGLTNVSHGGLQSEGKYEGTEFADKGQSQGAKNAGSFHRHRSKNIVLGKRGIFSYFSLFRSTRDSTGV